MRTISMCIIAGLFLALFFRAPHSQAAGLYADYTSYFEPIDTTWVSIDLGQAELQYESERSVVLSARLAWRFHERSLIRLELPYPTLRVDGQYDHGIGDGIARLSYRLLGDTLGTSGLYLLAEARLPMGAKAHRPLAYASFDGGAGFEIRETTSYFCFRLASTFTLVGDRVTSGPFINDNYATVAASIETQIIGGVSFTFSGFGLFFRGGESREIYAISFGRRLVGDIGFALSGALEAGSSESRVYDSQVGFSMSYALPAPSRDGR